MLHVRFLGVASQSHADNLCIAPIFLGIHGMWRDVLEILIEQSDCDLALFPGSPLRLGMRLTIVSQAIPFAERKGLVTLQPLNCHQEMQLMNIPVRC